MGGIGRRARVYDGRIARSHLALARRMRLPGSPPALASSTMGERWRCLGATGPLSQGVQEGRQALKIRHIDGMEVRRKRPRGFK